MLPAIVLGDKTTSGGIVIEGSPSSTVNGKPIARYGDKATCPAHKGVFPIIEGDQSNLIEGKPTAYHMSALACGCKVMASQLLYFVNGPSSRNASQASFLEPASAKSLFDQYNDKYQILDAEGQPYKNTEYAIVRQSGEIEYGKTNGEGHTLLLSSLAEAEEIEIYIEG